MCHYVNMKSLNKFILIGVALVGLLIYIFSSPEYSSIQSSDDFPFIDDSVSSQPYTEESVVRLGKSGKKPFCSAFVIAKNYALTASHCLVDRSGAMKNENLLLITSKHTIFVARPVGVNTRVDIGYLTGDFGSIRPLPVDLSFVPGMKKVRAVACGYPQAGVVPHCVPVSNLQPTADYMEGYSQLIPGMSGGPLIGVTSSGQKIAIGINVYMREEVGNRALGPVNTGFSTLLGVLSAAGKSLVPDKVE
jgi:hypothetical protein